MSHKPTKTGNLELLENNKEYTKYVGIHRLDGIHRIHGNTLECKGYARLHGMYLGKQGKHGNTENAFITYELTYNIGIHMNTMKV